MTGDDEFTDDQDFKPQSLDDILDGGGKDDAATQGTKPAEPTPVDPAKGDVKTDATPASPAIKTDGEPVDPAKPEVDVKGIIDERRKRQAVERELEELKRASARPQPQQQQVQQRPDPIEDPEGARRWDQAEADERAYNERCLLSESLVIEMKGEQDYREKEDAFLKETERNPGLRAALRQSPNPALFAYKIGKQALEMAEIGPDLGAYKAKLKEQIKAELQAELGIKPAAQAPQVADPAKPTVPKTLAAVQSAVPRGGTQPVFEGPTPLDKILPN